MCLLPACRPVGGPVRAYRRGVSSSTGTRGRRPSPAVYRRRRIGALLVLLLVVAGVVWGVTAFLGRDAGAAPEAGTTEAPTGDEPTEDPSPGLVEACAAADLETDVALEPAAPAAGSGTSFQVTVRNTGERPCLVDAGPATLAATVVSGADPVWSSAHCAGDATKELLLDTGAETAVSVPWNGRRSAEGCPSEQPYAGAGTYRVTLELAGESLGTRQTFTVG